MPIESPISTKSVAISEEMKRRGFRQQPLVRRLSGGGALFLTDTTYVYSYQAPTRLSVLGLPVHISRLTFLSVLGYESPVRHLARRWEARRKPPDTELALREAAYQEIGWKMSRMENPMPCVG